jgi:hypothetical protein
MSTLVIGHWCLVIYAPPVFRSDRLFRSHGRGLAGGLDLEVETAFRLSSVRSYVQCSALIGSADRLRWRRQHDR